MNKGFSLMECVVYIICLTIIFGLLGEMVFRFYLRIDSDLKSVHQLTSSLVCLNNIIHDLSLMASSDAIKKIEYDMIVFKQATGDVMWQLKGDKLYRSFKKFGLGSKMPNTTVSLMMQNVTKFDLVKCFQNDGQLANSLAGFKIILKSRDMAKTFEHHMAIRGSDV